MLSSGEKIGVGSVDEPETMKLVLYIVNRPSHVWPEIIKTDHVGATGIRIDRSFLFRGYLDVDAERRADS